MNSDNKNREQAGQLLGRQSLGTLATLTAVLLLTLLVASRGHPAVLRYTALAAYLAAVASICWEVFKANALLQLTLAGKCDLDQACRQGRRAAALALRLAILSIFSALVCAATGQLIIAGIGLVAACVTVAMSTRTWLSMNP